MPILEYWIEVFFPKQFEVRYKVNTCLWLECNYELQIQIKAYNDSSYSRNIGEHYYQF